MSKKTLSYRPLAETDVDSLVSLWGDYEVIKYTGIKKVLMPTEILERIRLLSDYDMFAVLNGKELIGVVGCLSTDDNKSFSLSYHFKKAVWGYGFATQSVEWMLSHISQQ